MTWDWVVQRTGKYCSIRRMEYPEFQTGIFGRTESAHSLFSVLISLFAQYKNVTISKIRYLKMKKRHSFIPKKPFKHREIEVTSWLVSADDFSSRVARGANERVSAANE